MNDSRQALRLQRIWSALIAAIIVAIAIFQPERRATKVGTLQVILWVLFFAAFLVLVWMETGTKGRSRRATLWIAAAQSAFVLAMVPMSPAIGSEGMLFVIVTYVIARQLSWPMAAAWVGGQTLLWIVILDVHWTLHHAVATAVTSLPFQFLALYSGRVVGSELAARNDLSRTNAELRATQDLLADSNRAAERFRISRELHDVLGHRLTALSLNLEIATVAPEAERAEPVARAYAITRELLEEVRDVVENLRGGAQVDLARALETLTREVPRPHVHLELPPRLVVDSGTQAHVLLRCAQEVVTNAMKHSDARHLWLRLADSADGVELVALDDGRGAASLQRGHGLKGLEERLREVGGRLEAGNAAGGGFRVRVVIPGVVP